MRTIDELTGLYSLSKTLRFELKPVGATLSHIEEKGLIVQDTQRADEYKKVKEIIDRYHKRFISMCLSGCELKMETLEQYVALAQEANRDEAEFDKVKASLRKQIVECFKKGGSYADLFKKELIQKHLPEFVTEEEEKKMVGNFSKFTSYFAGFYENRKNMYSDEDKSTTIAYRLIHENLPMFLDNMRSFRRIAESTVSSEFADIEAKLNVGNIAEMFELAYFSHTLTQEKIALYNDVVGGRTLEDGTKFQGVNEYVNRYNQKHKDAHLPLLKPLYKMILSDRVALSWLPEEFTSDEEIIEAIKETCDSLNDVLMGEEGLRDLLLNIDQYDVEHIYIANDLGLTNISQQMFGQYDVYTSAIKQEYSNGITPTPKERREPEKLEERINDLFKSVKSFSISRLNSYADSEHTIQNYFKQLGAYDREGEQRINLFAQIEMAHIAASDILAGKHGNIGQSEKETGIIKELLDAYKSLQHFIKPLLGNGDEADKDNEFDAKLRKAWNALDIITPLYNKVRNWLTRKPYSNEKIKLNFENAQLLGGWDMNKETDCTSILLRKGGFYYLAIMDKKSNHAFDIDELPCEGECYEKMDYKQIALPMGLGAFVRKCTGTAKKLGWSCPKEWFIRHFE